MAKILQDISFGENLQKIRKSQGLTQNDVCARLATVGRPMLQSTYAQIETGARNIFLSDLIALRMVLKIEYDDIFEGLTPIDKYEHPDEE